MKENLKLLIADENENLTKEIESTFAGLEYGLIERFNNGKDLVEKAKEIIPDVVIMDLILPQYDGYKAIEEIKKINKDCKIIIHSSLSSQGFINKAINLGADYFVVKPFNISLLKTRVNEIVNEQEIAVTETKKSLIDEKISNIFITVGIPAHIKGYQFLREAIKLTIESPEIINSITKKLYPSIAKRYDTSASKVERAIRHAIEVAWNRGKIENINNLFGVKVYNSNEKPTNGEFIALVADKMLIEGA